MEILCVPFGSEGDVNPHLVLAEELAGRGHAITFVVSPVFEEAVRNRGFGFVPLGSREAFEAVLRNPQLWHPRQGTEIVLKWVAQSFEAYPEALDSTGRSWDLVITTSFAVGAGFWAQARQIPWIMTHLQPTCFRSVHDTPVPLGGWEWFPKLPPFAKALVYGLLDRLIEPGLVRPMNAARTRMGLPPLTRYFTGALEAADLVTALFPAWYAPAQPDWPRHVRQLGFPLPPPSSAAVPGDIEAFLEAGPPPVLFTHGSANWHADEFLRTSLRMAERLGVRALLVNAEAGGLPRSLPSFAHHARRVPFEHVFGRCAAAVHHGGIGTLAKAAAAGIPQLVVPLAHDQPDNASRVERTGIGLAVPLRAYGSARSEKALRRLLVEPGFAQRAQAIRRQMLQDETPARRVFADLAEELAARRSLPAATLRL